MPVWSQFIRRDTLYPAGQISTNPVSGSSTESPQPLSGTCVLPTNPKAGQAGVNDPYFATEADRTAWIAANPTCTPPPPFLPDTPSQPTPTVSDEDCQNAFNSYFSSTPSGSTPSAQPEAADYQAFASLKTECGAWAQIKISALPQPQSQNCTPPSIDLPTSATADQLTQAKQQLESWNSSNPQCPKAFLAQINGVGYKTSQRGTQMVPYGYYPGSNTTSGQMSFGAKVIAVGLAAVVGYGVWRVAQKEQQLSKPKTAGRSRSRRRSRGQK